jgi:class 3 adenylate cyclase
VAEHRLSCVLSGDLVGLAATDSTEADRDPEEVRELLSRYFDTARLLVARYGGTVEKFIGDAVMAVWGVPTAHEDDAERAVRAGLDLVAAVEALGEEIGEPGLAMRVGVVTGEVAVTLGAVGQGMVAGDAVNTASRVQAVAAPGEVWVDEATRALSSAAVSYRDAGVHQLKGKSEPVALYAAGHVVAAVGGAQRVDGLEAPFTGRDRELRLVKELFHACAEEGRPRLVAVSGPAGIGKSRLGWEFEKYIDGLRGGVWWHRGRCLSYGDGVAFYALAEMVRSRLDILDGDPPTTITEKVSTGLARHVTDPTEREWLAPRIRALVGSGSELSAGGSAGRDELFPAWRTFLERVSDGRPLVLLVEDLQWADAGLLDFLDHVLETSHAPIFLLTLARPDLEDIRSTWATGRRSTRLHLEPMPDRAMGALVDGLVAGLPEASRHVLVSRAEGVPLYAVETIRALIDRDAVVPRDGRYVLAADADAKVDLATLGAPPSLQALLSARLDALTPAERRLVQDASVLGLRFTVEGLEALGHNDPALRGQLLESLVRREFFTIEIDPRSPERGQHSFVQALVRTVAYDTLSRRDRKARHLAVARKLAAEPQADELAGVIANHYLDARAVCTSEEESVQLATQAVAWLERAAQRAADLGSPAEAQQHFEAALALVDTDVDIARLAGGAARNARLAGRSEAGVSHALRSRDAYLALGDELAAASAVAEAADALIMLARIESALSLLTPVHQSLVGRPGAEDAILDLDITLMRAHLWAGNFSEARAAGEEALRIGEALQAWPRLARSMSYFGSVLLTIGQPVMGFAVLQGAVELTRKHGLTAEELPALNNIAAFSVPVDLPRAVETARRGIAIARHLGHRALVNVLTATLASALWLDGGWDELEALTAEAGEISPSTSWAILVAQFYAFAAASSRGRALKAPEDVSGDDVRRATLLACRATVAAVEGRVQDWLREGAEALDLAYGYLGLSDDFHAIFLVAVEASIAANDLDLADKQIALVREAAPNEVSPYLRAQGKRLEALLSEARGQPDGVEEQLREATAELRAFGAPYWLGRVLMDLGICLIHRRRDDEAVPLLQEAADLFEKLGATPLVEQTRALLRQTASGRLVERLPLSPGVVPRPGTAADWRGPLQPS